MTSTTADESLDELLARLPCDACVHIARCGTGATACAMERVCSSWHEAIGEAGDALWKPLALAQFPRLAGILQASRSEPPSFRELYRDQAEAEAAPTWLKGERPRPDLNEFVFSIELLQSAWGEGFPATVHAWQGAMRTQDTSPNQQTAALVGAELWPAKEGAVAGGSAFFRAWRRAYDAARTDYARQEDMRSMLGLRVFVTRRHGTMRIFERPAAMSLSQNAHTPWMVPGPDVGAAAAEPCRRLDWPRFGLPMPCSRTRALLDPAFEPALVPELLVPTISTCTGRLVLHFTCDERGAEMNADEIVDYLDLCLPWPTP